MNRNRRRRTNVTREQYDLLPATKPVSSIRLTGTVSLSSGNNYVLWSTLGLSTGDVARISSVAFEVGSATPVGVDCKILDGSGAIQTVSRNFMSAGSNVKAILRNSRRSPLTVVTSSNNAVDFFASGTATVAYEIRVTKFD